VHVEIVAPDGTVLTPGAGAGDIEVDAAGDAGDSGESADLPECPVLAAAPAEETLLPPAAVNVVPEAVLRLEVVPDIE
jgi:hypothetical protein